MTRMLVPAQTHGESGWLVITAGSTSWLYGIALDPLNATVMSKAAAARHIPRAEHWGVYCGEPIPVPNPD